MKKVASIYGIPVLSFKSFDGNTNIIIYHKT